MTANSDYRGILIRALKALQANGPTDIDRGICHNYLFATLEARGHWVAQCDDLLFDAFAAWPKFSGSMNFPIPGPGMCRYAAFSELPLWEGEYGDSRKELLSFCIDYLEEQQ